MSEATLNAFGKQLVDMTLNKSRYDALDLEWYTESPFWRRTNMNYSREYKTIPDYEIGDLQQGLSLNDILYESESLESSIIDYRKKAKACENERIKFLLEHTHNLNVRTKLLLGQKMSFNEMTNGLYNLVAPKFDYSRFDNMHSQLGKELPGSGDVNNRIDLYRKSTEIPKEELLSILRNVTLFFHNSTVDHMNVTGNSMPRVRVRNLYDDKTVFLSILFGYDYDHIQYERNFNLNYCWTIDNVIEYIGHEMEPGHLTFFEKRLQKMIDTCWPEMMIISQYSASSAFTEGAARHAIDLVFNESIEEKINYEIENIIKPAHLDISISKHLPLWHEFIELSGYGKLEASRNIWDGKWSKTEAAQFLEKYGFVNQGTGLSEIDSLMSDDGHYVCHDYSRDIQRKYFHNHATSIEEQWKLYEKMCSLPISMSDIVIEVGKPT